MSRKPKHNDDWDRAQEMYYDSPGPGPSWNSLSDDERAVWYKRAQVQRKQSRAALAFCRAYPTHVLEGERDYAERIGARLIDIAQDELHRENNRKDRPATDWSKPTRVPSIHDQRDAVAARRALDSTQAPYAAVTTPFIQNGAIEDMDELTRRGKIVAYNEVKMAMAMRTSDLAVKGDAIHPETAQAMARGVEILASLLDVLDIDPDPFEDA